MSLALSHTRISRLYASPNVAKFTEGRARAFSASETPGSFVPRGNGNGRIRETNAIGVYPKQFAISFYAYRKHTRAVGIHHNHQRGQLNSGGVPFVTIVSGITIVRMRATFNPLRASERFCGRKRSDRARKSTGRTPGTERFSINSTKFLPAGCTNGNIINKFDKISSHA